MRAFPTSLKGKKMFDDKLFETIIRRTLRVPIIGVSRICVDGGATARKLDVALMNVGFKCSRELFEHLSALHPVETIEIGARILFAVRELIGDDKKHNVYFKNFPNGVPNTKEFWMQCIVDALLNPTSAGIVAGQISEGRVNLLDLPSYGKYLHSYEDMLAAHDEFIPNAQDRVTVLNLGKDLSVEILALYHLLAQSTVPLNDDDRSCLARLSEICLTDDLPKNIPIRENKAVINSVRVRFDKPLLVDTPTDVLRLACALSNGDVTLSEKTKFVSFSRKLRKSMMVALDTVALEKLSDINQYREAWKRIAERLHPHEYPQFANAQRFFSVARKEEAAKSFAAKIETAFAQQDVLGATKILVRVPGILFRSLDRILRTCKPEETDEIFSLLEQSAGKVAMRVLFAVREHLQNRNKQTVKRIFANSKGKAFVVNDEREKLNNDLVCKALQMLDDAISRRLPVVEHLIFDPAVLDVALPTSNKNMASGFSVMPRGSAAAIAGEFLRFFVYWKQKHERTDYDLSVLLLDKNFERVAQVSWTSLRADGIGKHSGDITSAANGASEFIDIDLRAPGIHCIIPQINIYSGESFMDAEEALFGFMTRTVGQKGKPFEPRSVQMKSDLRGKGKVALPVAFVKSDDGTWRAKWLNMYLNGYPSMNRVEENRLSTSVLTRAIIEREYLTVRYWIDLLKRKNLSFSEDAPIFYIGLHTPENLPKNSKVVTLKNLFELIPS